jgi:hypothetical protein
VLACVTAKLATSSLSSSSVIFFSPTKHYAPLRQILARPDQAASINNLRAACTLNGKILELRYGNVSGRQPLESNELKIFKEIVSARALEIVAKWVDFFIMHKPIKPETITQRLK